MTAEIAIPVRDAGVSPARAAWRRLLRNRMAVASGVILSVLLTLCFVGPWVIPYSYQDQDLKLGAAGPSLQHPLGTDKLGRDQLARIFYGGRVSFGVGLAATTVALTIGLLYGAIAGFVGGKVDAMMMRFVDILYALPFAVFVILLVVMLKDVGEGLTVLLDTLFEKGSGIGRALSSYWNLLLLFAAIGAVEWLTMARIVRGQVLALKQQDFVAAAVTMGARKRRIILQHLIPNVLGPVIVYTTLTIPAVMLLEAFLSFLGLGVQPPMSSWGVLIKEGAEMMEEAPWLLMFPGSVFAITLFCLNFLGDGLRDALDVRSGK